MLSKIVSAYLLFVESYLGELVIQIVAYYDAH